jgi:hypothetical protein
MAISLDINAKEIQWVFKWIAQRQIKYHWETIVRPQGLFKVKWHSPCHKLTTTFFCICKSSDDHKTFKVIVHEKAITINLQAFMDIFPICYVAMLDK